MTSVQHRQTNGYLMVMTEESLVPPEQEISQRDLTCASVQRYACWAFPQAAQVIPAPFNPVGYAIGAAAGCGCCFIIGVAKEIGVGEAKCLGESLPARIFRMYCQPVPHSFVYDWVDWGQAWASIPRKPKMIEAGMTACSGGVLTGLNLVYQGTIAPYAGAYMGATPGFYAGRETVYRVRQMIECCRQPSTYDRQIDDDDIPATASDSDHSDTELPNMAADQQG